MLSTPPPMAASAPSFMTWWAAMAMAWRPDEQNRFTVVPGIVAGRPARIAETRAMLWPWEPWGWPQPRITSSTSLGSSWGALPSTSRMQCAASSSGRVRLKEPRNDLASGVRELATTTASLMVVPFGRKVGCSLTDSGAAGDAAGGHQTRGLAGRLPQGNPDRGSRRVGAGHEAGRPEALGIADACRHGVHRRRRHAPSVQYGQSAQTGLVARPAAVAEDDAPRADRLQRQGVHASSVGADAEHVVSVRRVGEAGRTGQHDAGVAGRLDDSLGAVDQAGSGSVTAGWGRQHQQRCGTPPRAGLDPDRPGGFIGVPDHAVVPEAHSIAEPGRHGLHGRCGNAASVGRSEPRDTGAILPDARGVGDQRPTAPLQAA